MSNPANSPPHISEEEIFQVAAALPSGERAAYLDSACAGPPELRAQVDQLLAAHDAGGFMEETPFASLAGTETEFAWLDPEKAGERIGRYKLLEKIGEGGFGMVWVAEQEEPVRRRVALKIIKLGMDTREVIARFEQERQALALMDHPNIATVLDAGATPQGRPFFVLELVRGIKITEFCDQANLSTKERLELFISVCQAVQHAHQKGVIHRDLKPSNILVTRHDGVPVPKVIDFGVAKATHARLAELTIHTHAQQLIGTPLYMSPEQAELSGRDVDTRSDIYSLGVLLYELLTGRTPIDSEELRRHGLDEIRRRVREVEPARPSTLLRTLAPSAREQIARQRATEAPKLIALVRGDLDSIVMKALEKDRARRYGTAQDLARDIQRHLASEPVAAAPQSAAYRVRKFLRRHRVAVTTSTAVLLALIGGIIMTAREASRARTAEHLAETRLAQVAREKNVAREQLRAMSRSDQAVADAHLRDSDWSTAIAYLGRAIQNDPENTFAQEQLLSTLVNSAGARDPLPRCILSHSAPVHRASFSPDGTRIVTASEDHTARLWDAATGEPVGPALRHGDAVQSASFNPDGTRVLTASRDQTARIWDAATGPAAGAAASARCRRPQRELQRRGKPGFNSQRPWRTRLGCGERRIRWRAVEARRAAHGRKFQRQWPASGHRE